jgi:colanic acid/amylovoran biosynthesis protein
MNEKILIINVHSSRNLGDAALLQVTLMQLKQSFPKCRITICMDDPESHFGDEQVIGSIVEWCHPKNTDSTVSWNYRHLIGLLPTTILPLLCYRIFKKPIYLLTPNKLKTIIDAYTNADIVISGPGGFLYSSGRGISLLVTVYSILMAIIGNKAVYILPQSIGPFKRLWQRKIVHWMLERVRIIMVREPISFKLIKTLGVNHTQMLLIPDMAFALPKADKATGAKWLEENGFELDPKKPILGMTILNWGEQHKGFDRQAEYELGCGAAIEWFVKNTGGKVILFPQVFGPYLSQDDRVPARRVVQLFPELAASIFMVEQPLSIELIRSIYSWMDVFIGTRMHSNIFSISEGVPVIMIGYLPKTKGLAEMLGIEDWYLEINQVIGNGLITVLQKFWDGENYWTDNIKQKVQNSILEASGVGELVKVDYESWVKSIANG